MSTAVTPLISREAAAQLAPWAGAAPTIPPETLELLKKPLPPEAVKQHPTKKYLSAIKVPFMIERLNEAFGLGGWRATYEIVEAGAEMIVVKICLTVPRYGIHVEAFGGNDNTDRGDAYKGACTDALSKAASVLYIGMDVYKGLDPITGRDRNDLDQRLPECTECGEPITAVRHKGETIPLVRIIAKGKAKHKRLVCGPCQIKLSKEAPTTAPADPPPSEQATQKQHTEAQAVASEGKRAGDGQDGTYFAVIHATSVLDAKTKKHEAYLQVEWNEKRGKCKASCFDKGLFQAVRDSVHNPTRFVLEDKGKYTNIVGVAEEEEQQQSLGITDEEIPF